MTIRTTHVAAALALAAALLPARGSAQAVLAAPYYFGTISSGSGTRELTHPGGEALPEVSITVLGFPMPSLLGRADGQSDASATFSGDISYSFTVDGPVSGMVVPLSAVYALHASAAAGVTTALATFSITGTSNDVFERLAANGTISDPGGIFGTRPVSLEAGHIGVVSIGIGGFSSGGVVDAYVDPFISIDPGFLASHPGYSVRVSAGVGNSAPISAVPEPESLAMLLSGIGMLVAWRRLGARRWGA